MSLNFKRLFLRRKAEHTHKLEIITMAKFDDLLAAIEAKHAEHAAAVADRDSQIAALKAEKDALTADLAAAHAAVQAIPALPVDAASADQVQAAIDAVKAL